MTDTPAGVPPYNRLATDAPAHHGHDLLKTWVQPFIVPVVVGISSATIATAALVTRIDERMIGLERRLGMAEAQIETMRERTAEQGSRLAAIDAILRDVAEIKADIREIMRGGRK